MERGQSPLWIVQRGNQPHDEGDPDTSAPDVILCPNLLEGKDDFKEVDV